MTDSEFRVYPWIEKSLRNLGWNTRNPSRGGQVYTQGEFVKSDRFLKQSLEGRPEFIVLVPDGNDAQYWIIEAKASTKQIEQASREAMDYADQINNKKTTKRACFTTGVAGTSDDAILVNTKYWNGNKWKTVEINGFESSGFLSDDQCQEIIRNNNSKIELFEMDLENLIQKAHQINESFHANEIPVKERAQTISALLLAIIQDGNLRIHSEPRKLMREINGNIQDLLQKHGKGEYAEAVKLSLPATDKNHKKYRQALVEVLQHLRDMNIRSAINSGDDILGQFYETFLKYANGAKEMGIVLTPRHITKFAVDVLGINSHDRVFDPTCGTGGFLVSAMDHVRKNLSTPPLTGGL